MYFFVSISMNKVSDTLSNAWFNTNEGEELLIKTASPLADTSSAKMTASPSKVTWMPMKTNYSLKKRRNVRSR